MTGDRENCSQHQDRATTIPSIGAELTYKGKEMVEEQQDVRHRRELKRDAPGILAVLALEELVVKKHDANDEEIEGNPCSEVNQGSLAHKRPRRVTNSEEDGL